MRHPYDLLIRWVLVALLLAGAGVAASGFLLYTSFGARIAARFAAHALPARSLTFDRLEGSLWTGLVLSGVTVRGLRALPGIHQLTIGEVHVAPLRPPFRLGLLRVTLRGARLRAPGIAQEIRAATVTGSAAQGWTLREIVAEEPAHLPAGSLLRVQQMDVDVDGGQPRLRAIQQGRLKLPYSETILIEAAQQAEHVTLRIYSTRVDAPEILAVLLKSWSVPDLAGTITDVDLRLDGSLTQLRCTGTFRVATLSHRGFGLADALGTVDLTLTQGAEAWQAQGAVTLKSGIVTARNARVMLSESRITLPGQGQSPGFHLRGTATVEDTRIDATLRGTLEHPELKLFSDPPHTQGRLLVMLLTGKSWRGSEIALEQGQLSTAVVRDAIDYFVFGGRGEVMAHHLGLSEFSLIYDPTTGGVGVKTGLFGRLEASYAVSRPDAQAGSAAGAAQPPGTTHKVGAAITLTPDASIAVEGEKTVQRRSADTTAATATGTTTETTRQNFLDQLLLKFKLKF
ncbi:MAG: translocation/assembly module TamB domain-containing protein [Candidatus Omnitrophica bacterium]|nr:translocation/assembly module TamB domain-containing protein [Candidatus Omnitrophota bacterium]